LDDKLEHIHQDPSWTSKQLIKTFWQYHSEIEELFSKYGKDYGIGGSRRVFGVIKGIMFFWFHKEGIN
jgi:hypothetical protein